MRSPLAEILGDALVWDNHACMPMRVDTSFLPRLEDLRAMGINIISLNAAFGGDGPEKAEAMLGLFRDWVRDHSDALMLVKTVEDVDHAKMSGRLGLCFDLESMNALGGDISRVERFYELGVRWMLATYNTQNAAGGGCLSEVDGGLTDYGRAVVKEMNRVGMVVCGSHCGERTAQELIDVSASPAIFSHSNARAVWDHPRNISDEVARACAARGGVIGINGFGPFLGANDASTKAYVDHVEHMLDLVGDDHVGLALDFIFDADELNQFVAADPVAFPPDKYPAGAEMVEPARLPEIAAALLRRGYGFDTLVKLFGGNHRRIAETVWI